jgi:hypothetical protein
MRQTFGKSRVSIMPVVNYQKVNLQKAELTKSQQVTFCPFMFLAKCYKTYLTVIFYLS